MNIVIEKNCAFIGENCLVSNVLGQRIAQHGVIDCIKLSSHHCVIENPAKNLGKSTVIEKQFMKSEAHNARTTYNAPSAEHGVRSTEHEVRSTEHGVRSTEHEVRSTEHGVRSAEHEVRSTEHGVRALCACFS